MTRPLIYAAAAFCSAFGASLATDLTTVQQWLAAVVGALGSALTALKAAMPTPKGEGRNQPQPNE